MAQRPLLGEEPVAHLHDATHGRLPVGLDQPATFPDQRTVNRSGDDAHGVLPYKPLGPSRPWLTMSPARPRIQPCVRP